MPNSLISYTISLLTGNLNLLSTLTINLNYCATHSIVVILQKFFKQQYYEETFYSCIVRTRYVQCTHIRNGTRNCFHRILFHYAFR